MAKRSISVLPYLKIVAVIILSQMPSGSSFRSTICTVALRPIMYLMQSAGQAGAYMVGIHKLQHRLTAS